MYNGTEVKLLQYEMFAKDRCHQAIDLAHMGPYIMINIMSDKQRYHSCVSELRKLMIPDFVHLKATYWRHPIELNQDLNTILAWLNKPAVTIDDFSRCSDPNIMIQGGPLACYCSHMRAMMHAASASASAVFTIVEDDIYIANTMKIMTYISQIPDDWDIICLNANPIGLQYEGPVYKFKGLFHSTHFYIVKKQCLPTIFNAMYPVTDQFDILLSQLYSKLNIYNIIETVYQRDFSTNTQNNIHTILHSPNYAKVREYLLVMQKELLDHVGNRAIADRILHDLIYNYITSAGQMDLCCPEPSPSPLSSTALAKSIEIVLLYCVKGRNVSAIATQLVAHIDEILDGFNGTMDPLSYGSTCNVFRTPNGIYKRYNTSLRWSAPTHSDIKEIYDREAAIVTKVYPESKVVSDGIIMPYLGVSLYEHFELPDDWQAQLKEWFDRLDRLRVYYPEFNLRNILNHNGQLNLIDFGLASLDLDLDLDNGQNYQVFVDLLGQLQPYASSADFKIEYATFINNLRLGGKYPENIW